MSDSTASSRAGSAGARSATAELYTDPRGFGATVWSWITTVDHKRIGIMYATAALFFLLIGGAEALLMRIQLAVPQNDFVDAETFNQLFTMHGTTMIFLVAMPMAVAFFNYIVPLQIGARDVAFPRLNALSFWVFLFGGLYVNSSFLFNAAPNASWVGYANLTSTQFSPGPNVDFWVIGLSIVGVSSLIGAINFITTIVNLRAPGLTLMRLPLFTWMTFVTSWILVTAIPVSFHLSGSCQRSSRRSRASRCSDTRSSCTRESSSASLAGAFGATTCSPRDSVPSQTRFSSRAR
jgi:cytochrome c oxidase subunit 1